MDAAGYICTSALEPRLTCFLAQIGLCVNKLYIDDVRHNKNCPSVGVCTAMSIYQSAEVTPVTVCRLM